MPDEEFVAWPFWIVAFGICSMLHRFCRVCCFKRRGIVWLAGREMYYLGHCF